MNNPPETSSVNLPPVSKHIKKTLQKKKNSSYRVSLPNTSKSHPVQMRLGTYFKSIANNNVTTHPSLRHMNYGKSQTMFKLSSRITKAKLNGHNRMSSSSSSVSLNSLSLNESSSYLSSISPTKTTFWSYCSSSQSKQSQLQETILKRDEVPRDLPSNYGASSNESSLSSKRTSIPSEESDSMYMPSLSNTEIDPIIPPRITRAQRRQSPSKSATPKSSSLSLTNSPVLLLPVIPHIPQDIEPSPHQSRMMSKPNVYLEFDSGSLVSSGAMNIPVHNSSQSRQIPTKANLDKVQQLLQELSSNASDLQSLRSEYTKRKKFIDTTLEELSLSSEYSILTNRTIPLHQKSETDAQSTASTFSSSTTSTVPLRPVPRCQAHSNRYFTDSSTSPISRQTSSSSNSEPQSSTSPHPIPSQIRCNTKMLSYADSTEASQMRHEAARYKTPPFVAHILDDRFITQDSSSASSAQSECSQILPQQPSVAKPPSELPPTTSPNSNPPNFPSDTPEMDGIPVHPTVCLNTPQQSSNCPSVTPMMSGKLDLPVNKNKDSIRIIAQNCRGAFHLAKKHTDFYIPCMESLQGYSPDVICLSETNTDWRVRDNGYDADLMNRAIWSPSPTKTAVASCTWKNLKKTSYQPGGVLSTCMQSMPSRIRTIFRDPWGRYIKIIYQAKGNRNISLYNVYRTNPGSLSTSGIDTAWMQQWQCLKDTNDPCDPRQLCILHLIAEIQKDFEKNIHPIIVGDFNETLSQSSKNGLQTLMTSCNLVQVYQELVGFVPSSRHNNRSVFHFLAYRPLLKYVVKTGILPSETGFYTSDHIPFFVDFHKDLFNYKESPIVPSNLRKLKMYDSPSVEKYICYIKDQMHHHNILQRFLNLQDYVKIRAFDISAEKELELLDQQMTQIRLRAEKRLCPDPSRFKNASKMQIQVHRIRHLVSIQKFWKMGLDFSHLVCELKSYGLEDTDLSSIIKLQERISKERTELKFLHEEEDVVRTDHLEYLYEKAIEVQNKEKASIIKNMKMRENQKRSWSKIRYVTKSTSNRNIERLGIPEGFENKTTAAIWDYLSTPGVKPTYTYINDPYEIEKRLIAWQYHHYGQAKETPLASQYWHEQLDPLQKSDNEMDEIMTGELFRQSNLPSESKDFLSHMTSNIQPVMHPDALNITDIVFKKFYNKAKESTSSSPSGLHLGHWKAGAADKDICMVLSGIIRIAVQNTYTLERWRKVVSILMEKVQGQPNINKFRTIHLLESDMNFVLRYIWGRQFMRHNEKNNAWHSNQYGSRKGIQGQSATLNKVLTLDINRYYAEPAAIVDNDAKACYDRMIPVLLSYALIRLGLPKALTRFMCRWLEQATYCIKTSKGISKFKYGSCIESYLYGTGQGTGWSPPNWGAISDLISTVMGKNTPGMKLTHPNRKFYSDRSYDAFVDDVNGGLTSDGLYTFHPSPTSTVPLLQTIYEQIQINVQYYSRLLFTSGGKLALDKCRIYILEYVWKLGKRKMVNTADKYEDIQLNQTFQGSNDTIKLLNPDVARKMLGAYVAPDGNTKLQYKVLHELSQEWGQRVASGYLNRFDVQNSFKMGLIPALQYPLGIGVLSEHQCNQLLVPAMSILLNKMGVVRSINREIVHSPILYGGFALPNLYTIQGYHKVQMMLGHVRKKDTTTGDLIVIALATAQQEVGVSQPILSLSFSKYQSLLSACWLKEFWRFISSISGSFRLHSTWTPPPLYANDLNIMEKVIMWEIPDDKKFIINACRLYCKVYYVGELYEANGIRMKKHILNMSQESYHDDKFPVMSLPQSFKETWMFAIQKLRKDYPSASKFGALLHGRCFKYRMMDDMSTIFKYSKGKKISIYKLSPSPGKDLTYVEIRKSQNSQSWEATASYAITIDIDPSSLKLRLRHYRRIKPKIPLQLPRSLFQLNSIVQSTSQMEQKKFLELLHSHHPSIVRNIGKVHSMQYLRQLATALRNDSLIGVGDASVDQQRMGHAYILETKPPKYNMQGVAPVDCVEEDQTSNRGESFTVLAICTTVNILCKLYQIDKGSIVIYCDNKEALRRRHLSTSTFTSLSKRDIDVKMAVEHMVLTSPVSFSFQHVPGHADDDPDFVYEQATQQVQRNIDMHNLVTEFMKHPPYQFRPTNITPFLPHQQIALTLHDRIISGDIQQHIVMERHGLDMEQRLYNQRNIKHSDQHIIDWPALRLAIKNKDTLGRINATKILHNLWPTMLTLKDRNTGVSGLCPRCKKQQETVQHVFQCAARPSVAAFRESISRFRKQLVKLKTAKPIILALVELLVAFGQNRPPICPAFSYGDKQKHNMLVRIFQNQLLLGQNSLYAGYVSYKWSMLHSSYVIKSNTRPLFDVSWSSKIIEALWEFSTSIWRKRCLLVHKKNPEQHISLNDEELRTSIRTYLKCNRNELSPIEKSLHLNISSNIVRASTVTLARWLHLLAEERAKTIRLKRTQQISKGGTRPITGYFQRRVPTLNRENF